MKTSLKKIVAGASVATLVALNATFLTVNAGDVTTITVNTGNVDIAAGAAINTIEFTPDTALVDGDVVVVTYPDTFVEASTTATTDAATVATVDELRNTMTFTANSENPTVILTTTGLTAPAKSNVVLYIETRDGTTGAVIDSGSQEIYVGDANDVAVTATVAPILNMEIKATPFTISANDDGADTVTAVGNHFQAGDIVDVDALTGLTVTSVAGDVVSLWGTPDLSGVVNGTSTIKLNDPYAIAFGTLGIGTTSRSLDIETSTNAISGITVDMASTGLNGDNGRYIGTHGTVANPTATLNDSYQAESTFVQATASNAAFGAVDPDQTLSTTPLVVDGSGAPVDVAASQTVLAGDDVSKVNWTTTVQLDATIDAFTESGNYSDTLTFTVTGSF